MKVESAFLQSQFAFVSARHMGISTLGPILTKFTVAWPPNPDSFHLPFCPVLLLRALRLDHLKPLEDLRWQKREELPPFI